MSGMKFIGGMVAGAVVGSAIALLSDPMSSRTKRKLKKGSSHMLKTVGSVLDNVMYFKR